MTGDPAPARAAIDVRDVLDTLWLAAWLTRAATPVDAAEAPAERAPSGAKATAPAEPLPATAPRPGTAAAASAASAEATASTPARAASGDLYAPGSEATDSTVRARPIRIPAGSALPNGLPIVRALRPIPTRRPSRVEVELDEAATVEASTQGFGIVPVMRPRLERWFEAALVVEHSASSEVWAQTVIEIERMLEFSGTFRDVRTLRLRRTPAVHLVNEAGAVVRPERLRDPSARRIIFLFSPGVSESWVDGTLGRLIELWGTSTPVALLHALPRRLWANTPLGEPAALVTNVSPGGPNSSLRQQRAWWARGRRLDGKRAVVPVLGLDPESALRWAQMIAARRGRTAPAFLVPTGPQAPPRRDRPRREPTVEERVESLRANAPDAFRLAVRLAVGPFTMPIVQLVQAAILGRDAQHAQIAEVMLSGLVTRLTPPDANVAPEQVQFQFAPAAAALLLQSLRRDDARRMTALLQGYIQQHFGTPRDQLVLLNDPRGPLLVPAAAQPFARLNEQFVEWLDRSRPRAAADAPVTLQPAVHVLDDERGSGTAVTTSASSDTEDALRVTTLLRTFGELRRRAVPWLSGTRILWVDDRPDNNVQIAGVFEALGAHCEMVVSTTDGLRALSASDYHLVITDMGRPEGHEAGLDLLRAIRRTNDGMPVIVFAASWAISNRDRARREGAHGCTHLVAELIALVFETEAEVRARRYFARFAAAIGGSPALAPLGPEVVYDLPRSAARRMAAVRSGLQDRAEAMLDLVAAVTQTGYVQMFRRGEHNLPLVADRVESGLARYSAASLTGIIGRAARTGATVWVSDVAHAREYIAAEPSTRGELAIPLLDTAGTVQFVINIEARQPHAFSETQIRWLETFIRECRFVADQAAAAPVSAQPASPVAQSAPTEYAYWCFIGQASALRDTLGDYRVVAEMGQGVAQFVEALERELRTRVGPAANVFWTPRDFFGRPSTLSAALAEARAASRTLVPLLTPSYLHDEYAGKEWHEFAIRGGQNEGRIVPVIWEPLPPDLPDAVARLQLTTPNFPPDYATLGLRALGRSRDGARDFDNVVKRLADRIAHIGRIAGPTPPPPVQWEDLPNAFAPAEDEAGPDAAILRSVFEGDAESAPAARAPVQSEEGDASAQAAAAFGTDWAIVITMSEYDHLPALPEARRQGQAFTRWLNTPTEGAVAPAHLRTMASVEGDALEAIAADMLDASESRRQPLGRRLYIYASGHAVHDTRSRPSLLTREAAPAALGFSIPLVDYADWFSATGLFTEVVLVADLAIGAIATGLATRDVPFSPRSSPQAAGFYALSVGRSIGPFTQATLAGLRGAAAGDEAGRLVTSDDVWRYFERTPLDPKPTLYRRGEMTLARVLGLVSARFLFDERLVGEDAQIVDSDGQVLARAVAGVPWTVRIRQGTHTMHVAGEAIPFIVDRSATVSIHSTAPRRRVAVAGSAFELPEPVQWMCEAIGTMLARAGHYLVTGGWPGVDYLVARAFTTALPSNATAAERLTQVVPRDRTADFPDGTVIHVEPGEASFAEELRRADAVVLIGGAGGTSRMFEHAQALGLPVYPLPSSGGDALKAYESLELSEPPVRKLGDEVHSRADAAALAKRLRELLADPSGGPAYRPLGDGPK